MPTLIRCAKARRKGDQIQTARPAAAGSKLTQTATETWLLVYDGPAELTDVAGAADTPVGIAASFPFAGGIADGLFCISVQPVRDANSPNVWYAQVQSQTILQPDDSVTGNWSINLSRTASPREETATRDGIGEPLINVNGDLLPELPNDTIYDELLKISYSTKNVPPWANATDEIEGRVNEDEVEFTICGITRTFAPRQLRCTSLDLNCDRTVIGRGIGGLPINRLSYNVVMSFQVRKPDWTWVAPNEGYMGTDPGTGDKVHFTTNLMDVYNSDKYPPATIPYKLDEQGTPIQDDRIVWIPEDLQDDDRFSQDGRFVIPKSTPMAALFDGLNDDEQLPPAS